MNGVKAFEIKRENKSNFRVFVFFFFFFAKGALPVIGASRFWLESAEEDDIPTG